MEEDFSFDPPFVGRVEHLRKLETAWKSHAIFGVFGVRAVGKSTLVQEFFKRNCKQLELKWGCNLVQVDLKMFETTTDSLIQLVYSSLELMPDVEAIQKGRWKEHIASEVRNKLTKLHVMTLWFDNAEDVLDRDKNVHDQFLSLCVLLVRFCKGLKIVITSTTKFLFTQVRKAYFQLELPPMTKAEIIQLLRLVATDVKFGDFEEPLAEQCEGLPQLATMIGSELSEDGGMTEPEDMFALLLENKLKVLSREFYPKEDRIGREATVNLILEESVSLGSKQEVTKVVSICKHCGGNGDIYLSFLQRLPEVSQRRLATLNYIPGSFNASEARDILGFDKVATVKDQALIPIRRRFMLNYDPQTRRFNIQGILRNCMDSYFKWANIPAVRKRYCHVFTKVMKEVCEEMGTTEYASALTRFSAEQPNLQKLLTEVMYSEEDTYSFFIEVADSCSILLERFFSRESERFYTGCLDLATKYGNKQDLAKIHMAVGSLHTNGRGDFREGEQRYRQAMNVLKGEEDSKELVSANQRLGWSLYKQGRHLESLRCLETARQLCKSLGLEHSTLFQTIVSSLGAVNNAAGNFEKAKHYHFQSLKWRMRTQGSCHPAVGAMYNNIGLVYCQMGNREQALIYFEKGLEVKINSKAVLKSVVYSMNNIANQYCALKKFDKAENMLQDALQKLFDDLNHPKDALALTYDTLGKVYLAQGKFTHAEDVLGKAVDIRQDIMAQSVPFVESVVQLAQANLGLNRPLYAKLFIDKALELKGKCIEEMPQFPIIADAYEVLADIFSKEGNIAREMRTLTKQRDELCRLSHFLESNKCISKNEEIKKRLDSCQARLNNLNGRPSANDIETALFATHKISSKAVDNQVKYNALALQELKDSQDGFVTPALLSPEPVGSNRTLPSETSGHNCSPPLDNGIRSHFSDDKDDIFLLRNHQSPDNMQNDLHRNTGSEQTVKEKDGYFANFCRCFEYCESGKVPKTTNAKNIDVEESSLNNCFENLSFCADCGRQSLTDNTAVRANVIDEKGDGNSSKAMNIQVSTVDSSITNKTDSEAVSVDLNNPDFDSLSDNEIGGKEGTYTNNTAVIRNCFNNQDKYSRESETTCVCDECEIIAKTHIIAC